MKCCDKTPLPSMKLDMYIYMHPYSKDILFPHVEAPPNTPKSKKTLGSLASEDIHPIFLCKDASKIMPL